MSADSPWHRRSTNKNCKSKTNKYLLLTFCRYPFPSQKCDWEDLKLIHEQKLVYKSHDMVPRFSSKFLFWSVSQNLKLPPQWLTMSNDIELYSIQNQTGQSLLQIHDGLNHLKWVTYNGRHTITASRLTCQVGNSCASLLAKETAHRHPNDVVNKDCLSGFSKHLEAADFIDLSR